MKLSRYVDKCTILVSQHTNWTIVMSDDQIDPTVVVKVGPKRTGNQSDIRERQTRHFGKPTVLVPQQTALWSCRVLTGYDAPSYK